MLRLILFLALLLGLSGPVQAGPWPRAPGGVFLALSAERDRRDDRYTGLYGEYGLTPRYTLGMELGRSSSESSVLFWLQQGLDRGQGKDRWSAALGLGVIRRDGEYHPMGQAVLAWGRGLGDVQVLRRLPGGGWMSAELGVKLASVRQRHAEQPYVVWESPAYLTPERVAKANMTLGWNVTESLSLMGQFRLEDRADTGFASKVAISAVRDLAGPARGELGLILPLSGQGELALRLGTWIEF